MAHVLHTSLRLLISVDKYYSESCLGKLSGVAVGFIDTDADLPVVLWWIMKDILQEFICFLSPSTFCEYRLGAGSVI